MDWFEDLLKTGAEAYIADKGAKMENAKLQQAQILNTVEKEQQPSATPQDAKTVTGGMAAPSVSVSGIPKPYLYAGAGVAVIGLILLLRK